MNASFWGSVQAWMGMSAKASKQSTSQLGLVDQPADLRRPNRAARSASQPAAAKPAKTQAAAKQSKTNVFKVRPQFH
jgi:hypothetical protein